MVLESMSYRLVRREFAFKFESDASAPLFSCGNFFIQSQLAFKLLRFLPLPLEPCWSDSIFGKTFFLGHWPN